MSMARSFAGSAFLVSLFATVPASWAACPPARGVAVSFVPAARDLQIDGGPAVRLSGVSAGLALAVHGPFRLIMIDQRPDRWGRVAGLVIPADQQGESLNATLIRQGVSPAITPDLPVDCVPVFLAAEAEARAARRGVWAQGGLATAAADLDRLRQREGQFTLVSGRVSSVRRGRQRLYLNFGAFGSERFSVNVAVSRLPAFEAAGLDLAALKGQEIEVRGTIGPGLAMELTVPAALVKLRRS